MSILKKFVDANKHISSVIEKKLPHYSIAIFGVFTSEIKKALDEYGKGARILDVGGGRRSPIVRYLNNEITLIGVDISDEELKLNPYLKEYYVADVTKELPFEDNSIDLIISRSLIEHLESIEPFMQESHRVLKPGGKCIHLCPSRFAPFAIINQILPNFLAKKILYKLHPHQVGLGGFKAYYDQTYVPALPKLLQKVGFNVDFVKVGYYQSNYYSFFVPFYLLSALYELFLYVFKLKTLAANIVIVGRK